MTLKLNVLLRAAQRVKQVLRVWGISYNGGMSTWRYVLHKI